ncbi:MAG: hypothetical protein ACPGQR_04195, partial [Marinirhabdus sp.]
MKKVTFLFAFLLVAFSSQAQYAEQGPFNEAPENTTRALFDIEINIDIGAIIGANGLAGIIYIESTGEYWVSEWATDVIHVLDNTANFVGSFTIPGVSGTRSMTTDGTSVYHGTAGLNIFEVDPATRTLSNTITITTNSDAEARMCSYDETLDGGSGGFWIGDFGSDIASVDMSGNELSVIPSATHGTVIYGGAIDNLSTGGPFLWISDQSGTAPSRHFIRQLDPATGVPTGVVYDYTADGAAVGSTEVLAGGLFITQSAITPSDASLLATCQCTPSNTMFALELVEVLGVEDNLLSQISIFPNPAQNTI